jgi:very-short-patch-repair endonuclease
MTPAEKVLWERIRNRQLGGAHFRKQHPVRTAILDFYCARHKLVIEVDGGIHTARQEFDADRDRKLQGQIGCRILRFTNAEIFNDIDLVLDRIRAVLTDHRRE